MLKSFKCDKADPVRAWELPSTGGMQNQKNQLSQLKQRKQNMDGKQQQCKEDKGRGNKKQHHVCVIKEDVSMPPGICHTNTSNTQFCIGIMNV